MKMNILPLLAVALCTNTLACDITKYEKAFETVRIVDQRVVSQMNDAIDSYYRDLPEDRFTDVRMKLTSSLTQSIKTLQEGHNVLLRAAIRDCGWPKTEGGSSAASATAMLIIQHSDLSFMLEMHEHVRNAFEKRLIHSEHWATFVDRLAARRGLPQKYGTQILVKGSVMSQAAPELIWDVEDEANLDARRLSINLMPICQYLAGFAVATPLFERKCLNN